MDNADQLIEQARAGRGLWVGLSQLTEAPPQPFSLTIPDYPPIKDPHCTLVHLGKQSSLLVAPALKAADSLSRVHPAIDARIGGIARFRGNEREGDPIVFLIDAPIIRSLATQLREFMVIDGARLGNTYFDYKPHVTITRAPRDHRQMFAHPPNVSFAFRSIIVVCGDARAYFYLRG